MSVYKAFDLRISSEIPLPELILAENQSGVTDIEIVRSVVQFPDLVATSIHRRGIMAESAESEDGAIYLRWEGVAGYKATNGNTLYVESYTDDAELLSLFSISEALGCILLQRGLLLLHASSVQVSGVAYSFLGEPGAGKSTTATAFVKHGASLLSDDLTAICFDEENNPYVLPSYPQLKIWENAVDGLNFDKSKLVPVAEGINKFSLQPSQNFPDKPIPLARIFLLHKLFDGPDKQRLSPIAAPIELVRHFPLATHLLRGSVHQRHFQQSSWCAAHAEIWNKRRPDDFAALEEWVLINLET
ncbi:serine kinase [Persicitalea sp.]|uniref:serine kinase n=1 Tax=Persicitalea sp. TaxID=3100273 RepID=UPI003593D07E